MPCTASTTRRRPTSAPRLLLARRLAERGVRFVQVYSGGGPLSWQWDAHNDVNANHEKMCGHVDKPIAGLLTDLKRRGMLDDTLVVWCSEFGRTPNSQGSKGRDHNPNGYTMWLAGGGAKGGTSVGETDAFGLHAVKDKVSVHDFHATILYLLGIQHEWLTYRHNGRDERLTDIGGEVVVDATVGLTGPSAPFATGCTATRRPAGRDRAIGNRSPPDPARRPSHRHLVRSINRSTVVTAIAPGRIYVYAPAVSAITLLIPPAATRNLSGLT